MYISFQITEAGKDTLPDWLIFNELKAELSGIPGPEDKGQVYLKVIAHGDDNSKADDVFSIEVLDETYGSVGSAVRSDENGPKHVVCNREEHQTTVTVIVDCDLSLMKAGDKMKLVDSLVGHLNLAPEMIQLMPVGDKPMFDGNALVAGPGNIKLPKYVGGLLTWTVGCGRVENDHMPIIQLVETSAKDSAMSAALGHDIIGWHVTDTIFQKKHRKRRQVATATPTMSLAPPTKATDMMESSEAIRPSSSVTVMSTSTVEVESSSIVEKPTEMSTSTYISPSETIKMTKTMTEDATTILPSKTFIMTSEVMTETKVMPTSTVVTTSSTTISSTTTPTTTTKQRPKPTTPTTTVSTTTEKEKIITTAPMCPSDTTEVKAPYVRSPLKNFTVHAGVIKKLKIPENTFFDCVAGETSNLDLIITKPNGDDLPTGFWFQLHKRTYKPYQLLVNPLEADAGTYDFLLTAENFHQKSNSLKFNIVVLDGNKAESLPNHELSMTIDTDYDKFVSDLNNRLDLSNKIAGVFGDRNSNSMTVTRLERGSVIYAWTNNSLAGDDCNVEAIGSVFDKIVTEDGKITPEAEKALKPYKLTSVITAPLGSCENNPDFPIRAAMPGKPTQAPKTTEKMTTASTAALTDKPMVGTTGRTDSATMKKMTESTTANVAAAGAGGGGSDIWITTVVPAIVVVIVLIIALIIACCLYRKKRKGKMKLKEKNSFGTGKGVPVIFADELDEKPNDSTRPLIMDEERPPMPPPEYQRASSETSGNSNSTQPIGEKDIEEIEMEDTDITSLLYSPPPPVTASNNSKPPHVQSARGPPPYVPP